MLNKLNCVKKEKKKLCKFFYTDLVFLRITSSDKLSLLQNMYSYTTNTNCSRT